MNLRFPLYAKILAWFFLNLLLLVVIFYLFLRAQVHLGLDSLLSGPAGDHLQSVTQLISSELVGPKTEWNDVLKRFNSVYPAQFYLFRIADGVQVGGDPVELPADVSSKLQADRRGQPWGPPREFRNPNEEPSRDGRDSFRPGSRPPGGPGGPPVGPKGNSEFSPSDGPRRDGSGFSRDGSFRDGKGPFRGEPNPEFRQARPGGGGPPGPNFKVMVHTANPSQYWVIARIQAFDRDRTRPSPVSLIIRSDTLSAGGLYFDVIPWIAVGVGTLFVSVLFWIPLVRGITRSVSQITHATELVAEGQFDTRVDDKRRDELGRLGSAINRMASRLAGFVMGQKRFLGDIAHELCSPIARVQAALGILEQRANESQKPYVDDVREEVQHMSTLVNELLSFSKASLKAKEIKTVSVNIADVARKAVDREAGDSTQVQIHVPESVHAMAEPELLLRAVSNLVRNALRYAGHAGPITVSAITKDDQVTIMVADSGPGVPEPMLQQIFDPFFRLESSRSRDTGGIGLGLAIVKTCVESCQGSVSVKNLSPSGLQVEIVLTKAEADALGKPMAAIEAKS